MENITIGIPKTIEMILKQRSKEEHIEEDIALKQLLYLGAEKYIVEKYSRGEITIGKATELLNVDLYKMHEILEKYGVKASISYEHFVKGMERVRKV